MDEYTGLLTDIKRIREEPLLVRFALIAENAVINCLADSEEIGNKILQMENDSAIHVSGHFNGQGQLVVCNLALQAIDELASNT